MLSKYSRLAGALGLAVAAGCSPESNRAELFGRVALDSKPLPGGRVMVMSEDQRWSSSADIGPDGSYLIPDAPLGPVLLAVNVRLYEMTGRAKAAGVTIRADGTPIPQMSKQPAEPAATSRVPQRYADLIKSGLKATVGRDGTNYNVEMKSSK